MGIVGNHHYYFATLQEAVAFFAPGVLARKVECALPIALGVFVNGREVTHLMPS